MGPTPICPPLLKVRQKASRRTWEVSGAGADETWETALSSASSTDVSDTRMCQGAGTAK